MKFICNIVHPDAPGAARRIERKPGQQPKAALEARRRWLRGKIIGPPRPANWFLAPACAGIVGVYELEPGDVYLDATVGPRLYEPAA